MTDDVYRLYRNEWIIVFYATGDSDDTDCERLRALAQEHFDERFHGRIRPDDMRIICTGAGLTAIATLQLRMPNLRGEFKYAHLAQRHADEHGWSDWTVVARNSAADHELRNYGVTKLPDLDRRVSP